MAVDGFLAAPRLLRRPGRHGIGHATPPPNGIFPADGAGTLGSPLPFIRLPARTVGGEGPPGRIGTHRVALDCDPEGGWELEGLSGFSRTPGDPGEWNTEWENQVSLQRTLGAGDGLPGTVAPQSGDGPACPGPRSSASATPESILAGSTSEEGCRARVRSGSTETRGWLMPEWAELLGSLPAGPRTARRSRSPARSPRDISVKADLPRAKSVITQDPRRRRSPLLALRGRAAGDEDLPDAADVGRADLEHRHPSELRGLDQGEVALVLDEVADVAQERDGVNGVERAVDPPRFLRHPVHRKMEAVVIGSGRAAIAWPCSRTAAPVPKLALGEPAFAEKVAQRNFDPWRAARRVDIGKRQVPSVGGKTATRRGRSAGTRA